MMMNANLFFHNVYRIVSIFTRFTVGQFRLLRFAIVLSAFSFLLFSCHKDEKTGEVSTGTMRITSKPDGVAITILNKDVGITPRVTNPIPPGMYIVKLEKEGYQTEWMPVKVEKGKEVVLNVNMKPLSSTVVIDSIPSGAELKMNGRSYGDTPVVIGDLPLGAYKASVKLQGYSLKEIAWNISNDRPIQIKVPLTQNIGTLSLTSDPSVAAVTVNGRSYGNTPLKEDFEQGQYTVNIKKEGYRSFEKIITIVHEETTEENVKLEALPGSLTITSEPLGATVFMNDIEYGKTPYTRTSIKDGKYQLTLKKEGYDDEIVDIAVLPGAKFEKNIVLSPNTGTLVLAVNPVGMKVYIDGKFYCKTESESDKTDDVSKLITVKNLSFGKHTVKVSHSKATPKSRELQVNIPKGSTVTAPVIDFWLPNAQLILKNGSIYEGRLLNRYTADSSKITFCPAKGVKIDYSTSEIREITKLNIDE